jgi:hypothetical protein
MTTEALGVDVYIPVTFATGGTPVNNFGTAPTLLSAARNGAAFTPSSTTVSANGAAAQSYGYTLQGTETTLQGAGKYTLVFQCLDAAADYPIWLVELEIGQAWVTAISTLVNRIGAFTGTGVNTVLGFFKALMSKTASTPSDVGGTFDASTDSVEAIRDRGDAAWTGSAPPTASAIADAVWDEAVNDHSTSGSTGATLAAIKAKTDQIVVSGIRYAGSYEPKTQTLTVVRGNTPTVVFSNLTGDWTAATEITLGIRKAGEDGTNPVLSIAGSVYSATALQVAFPADFGLDLDVGTGIYEWDLTGILASGEVRTAIMKSPFVLVDRIAQVS